MTEDPPYIENWKLECDIYAFKGSWGAKYGDHNYKVGCKATTYSSERKNYNETFIKPNIESLFVYLGSSNAKKVKYRGEIIRGGVNKYEEYFGYRDQVYITPTVKNLVVEVKIKMINPGDAEVSYETFLIPMEKHEFYFPFIKMM